MLEVLERNCDWPSGLPLEYVVFRIFSYASMSSSLKCIDHPLIAIVLLPVC